MSGSIKHYMRLILFPTLLALLLASSLSLLVASTHVTRAQALAQNSISQPVQLDSPAIVRIISVVIGRVICYGCASDGSNVVSPQKNYFGWASSGSGVFVSPDGYILTADHVVDHTTSNPGDVDYLLNAAANDIASRYNTTPANALQILQDQYNQGNLGITIQVQSQTVFLSTAYTGQLQNTAQMISYPLTRVVASSPVDKQDTAIIQIEAHDMPFLSLAQNSTINIGDSVTAVGYPGDADCVVNNCDFTALLPPIQSDANTLSSLLDLSASTGQVTSKKSWPDGTPVYVVGGEIASAGSSGGPIIDQQGNIIGFVDAAPSSNRITFVVPSSVIQSYMQQSGISSPQHGKFMSLWTKAINDYTGSVACHWTNATRELTALHNDYPQFGAALSLMQNAQSNVTPTECPAPSQSFNIVPLIGGIAAVALLGTLLVIFFLRRRRQPGIPAPVVMPSAINTPVPVSVSSPALPQSHPQYAPYPPQGSTGYGYGSQVWQNTYNSQGQTYPASQGLPAQAAPVTPVMYPVQTPTPAQAFPPVQSPTPFRQCTSGHIIYEREARFCPDCGSTVHEVPVRQ
ncbi:MAG TPA: trypsin-like peptidase domain-containing protein [Ktedonobacteraceae bacterium]|nr:trypsin-like peptidase domain-containing protein [Ktedonobacteraceae bacterium]